MQFLQTVKQANANLACRIYTELIFMSVQKSVERVAWPLNNDKGVAYQFLIPCDFPLLELVLWISWQSNLELSSSLHF